MHTKKRREKEVTVLFLSYNVQSEFIFVFSFMPFVATGFQLGQSLL
jgi:hypothetical protein